MDNAKFWWSSSSTPKPGDVFGQSLRFRGNHYLSSSAVTILQLMQLVGTVILGKTREHSILISASCGVKIDKDNKNDKISFPAINSIEVKQRR